MPRIDCNYNYMRRTAEAFREYASLLKALDSRLNDITRYIPLNTSEYRRIRMQLRSLSMSKVTTTSGAFKRIANGLDVAAYNYLLADMAIANGSSFKNTTDIGVLGSIINSQISDAVGALVQPGLDALKLIEFAVIFGLPLSTIGALKKRGALTGLLSVLGDDENYEYADSAVVVSASMLGITRTIGLYRDYYKLSAQYDFYKGEIGSKTFEDAVKNGNTALENGKLRKKYSYNSDNKKGDSDEIKDANKFAEKKATIVGWGNSISHSKWRLSDETKVGMYTSSSELALSKLEAHSGFGAGDFTYKDKDGKTHHGFGVYSEIGSSYSLLEANNTQTIGNDNFGFHTESHVKIGSVSGEAGGQVAWTDKGPQIYAGGSFEAVAAEIGGSTGVKIAGVDVGVKGSVKFGVGASGKIGFKDGHFVCDFSASLGVGFSAGIDIDVGGMVKKVTKKATKVWNNICSDFKSFGKKLKFW